MEMFLSDKIFNYKFGGNNNQNINRILIVGDFLISYCKENQLYLICRHDGNQMNGNETTGTLKYVDGQLFPERENLEQKLETLIMAFTGRQTNAIPFSYFYYEIIDDNTTIVVYPQYLDKQPNIQINMNTDFDEELNEVSFMVRTEIVCLGPISNLNKEENIKKRKLIPSKNTDNNK